MHVLSVRRRERDAPQSLPCGRRRGPPGRARAGGGSLLRGRRPAGRLAVGAPRGRRDPVPRQRATRRDRAATAAGVAAPAAQRHRAQRGHGRPRLPRARGGRPADAARAGAGCRVLRRRGDRAVQREHRRGAAGRRDGACARRGVARLPRPPREHPAPDVRRHGDRRGADRARRRVLPGPPRPRHHDRLRPARAAALPEGAADREALPGALDPARPRLPAPPRA